MPRPSRFEAGKRYERLVMVSHLPDNYAMCRCDCGTEKKVLISHMTRGKTRSCGCLHKEVTSKMMAERNLKHGMYGTRIYAVWSGMKHRCNNPNNHAYKDYGARGIKVCKRWMKFENFLADMGQPPAGLTLERVNNNRGYTLSNCTWATYKEQANNRRPPRR